MRPATTLQRQWHILIALMSRRQGLTVKEMASEANVPERTIYRDLKSLKSLGFRLEEQVSDYGRKHWKFIDTKGNIRIHFTWSEAVSLYLGRQLLDPLAGTHFWQAAQSAFAKIRTTLDETALAQLDRMSHGFLHKTGGKCDYSQKADLIDRIMLGIEERRVTFIVYHSERATEPVSLEVYPYGLVYSSKGWLYLVAHSRDHEPESDQISSSQSGLAADSSEWAPPTHWRKPAATPREEAATSGRLSAIRTFKIDRVTDVDVQQLQFTRNPNFRLDTYFSDSFGIYRGESDGVMGPERIRIRFAKEASRYVSEREWHPSQRLVPQKDGSTILELTLGNTKELKSWILSFGPRATVLEPASLKNEILADLEQLLANYISTDQRRVKNK